MGVAMLEKNYIKNPAGSFDFNPNRSLDLGLTLYGALKKSESMSKLTCSRSMYMRNLNRILYSDYFKRSSSADLKSSLPLLFSSAFGAES